MVFFILLFQYIFHLAPKIKCKLYGMYNIFKQIINYFKKNICFILDTFYFNNFYLYLDKKKKIRKSSTLFIHNNSYLAF